MLNSSLSYASWFHSFTYKQFHILLNSLFKVLCNFPSRYLFAIGFAVVFSLRWSLPPALGCTLKQPDSSMRPDALRTKVSYGPSTRSGKESLSGELATFETLRCSTAFTLHPPYAARRRGLALDCSLFARRY